MTGRQELIERLMTEFFREPEHPSPSYERRGIVVSGVKITNPEAIKQYTRRKLERRIPAVESLKTCEDFKHLNVNCSDCACHSIYEIYDMQLVPLPEGGYAWVCCAIDHAIRPEWHAERDRLRVQTHSKTAMGRRTLKMLGYSETASGWERTEHGKPEEETGSH